MKRQFSRFLSLLLCFQILTVQNMVFAQGGEVEIPTITEPVAIESDAEGFNAEEQSYSRVEDVKYDDITSMLTNLAATSTGSLNAIVCGSAVTTDNIPHYYGALAYIAMAIASNAQMKKANENATADTINLIGASVGDTGALDTLKSLKDIEQERKKALRTKSIGLYAFTAALIVAEVLAILNKVTEITLNIPPPFSAGTVKAQAEHAIQRACKKGTAAYVISAANGIILGFMQSGSSESALQNIIVSLAPVIISSFSLLDNTLNDPDYISKAIFHGVVLGIVGTNTVITERKISETQKNVDDVSKMISDYNEQAGSPENEIVTNNTDGNQNQTLVAGQQNQLEAQRELDIRIANDSNLKELRTKLKPKSIGADAYKGVSSPTLSASINALNRIPVDLKSGNIAGVRASSQLLGRNIAKLKKIRNGLREKLNQKRVKAGQKAIDFSARANKIAKQLQSQTKAQVASAFAKNPQAQNALAKKETNNSSEIVKTVSGSDTALAVATKKLEPKSEDFLEDDLFGEELEDELNSSEQLSKKQESLDDYELAKNDIYKGSSQSIFRVLSVRYLKTAYPKLLEEK